MIDVKKTCFNVITKSGATAETMSQYLIISELLKKEVGEGWPSTSSPPRTAKRAT